MSDEGIKCSRTLREERRTVQKSSVAHTVLAQFLDAFNVDFLVDTYTSGMVNVCMPWSGTPMHQNKEQI